MESTLDVQQTIEQAKDALTVGRVFGEPVEKDGVTVIPAARVQGGAGGGTGEGPEGKGHGEGTGFGLNARPAGVYVLADGDAKWRPAVDANRAIVAFAAVMVAMLLVIRAALKRGPCVSNAE
jgi:uncharacterized spore protein YtfJ